MRALRFVLLGVGGRGYFCSALRRRRVSLRVLSTAILSVTAQGSAVRCAQQRRGDSRCNELSSLSSFRWAMCSKASKGQACCSSEPYDASHSSGRRRNFACGARPPRFWCASALSRASLLQRACARKELLRINNERRRGFTARAPPHRLTRGLKRLQRPTAPRRREAASKRKHSLHLPHTPPPRHA